MVLIKLRLDVPLQDLAYRFVVSRAQTFSSYKHHNTVKVLIGITPQGSISFVSEAWGGRTSDKYLPENCGFLEFYGPRGYCRISYVGGLGTSRCIMGLTTQDPYIQNEHTELYKTLKFRVNWASIEQHTAIQKLQNLQRNVWISGQVSGNPAIHTFVTKFLNDCILFNIGAINTKLKHFVKLGVLFLNIWMLCCQSHNTPTCTQAPDV